VDEKWRRGGGRVTGTTHRRRIDIAAAPDADPRGGDMYRYAAVAGMIVVSGLAPTAFAQDAPTQPSAIERLVRQEDARWNDPRLGITYPTAVQPTAIQRLVRQEDARPNDPRLGISGSVPATVPTPTVHIVGEDGFDWLAAAIGAVAGMATLLLATGLAVVARTQRIRRA
jgi:hypothetical protein